MEIVIEFLKALLDLSNAMAPYILFGLLFAGLLHEIVPESIVKNHLGKSSVISVLKATLFGIPLPVCSCGVIPLAAGIKKSGASNGATLSFLISTPITGVDSILATYGMFGWIFTIYRVITSMIISIVAGIISNIYAKDDAVKVLEEESCSKGSCCSSKYLEEKEMKKKISVKNILRYSFVTLLGDIAKPLLVGLFLGALITVLMPDDLSKLLREYAILSYIIALAIALPMYVCATASLPIAAALMLSGVSPGAAFVFLSAGPATNTVTIGIVKKMMGVKTLFIYLGAIITGSLLFGIGLDYIFSGINIKEIVNVSDNTGILSNLSSIVLWLLVFKEIMPHLFRNKTKEKCSCRISE